MTTCVKCGAAREVRDISSVGGCYSREECALRAELREVKAERDRLRTVIRINADETRDLRAAVLVVADAMHARGAVLMQHSLVDYAAALREAVGK